MKIGVNTLIWTGGFEKSNLNLLPAIKARGFDGIEIARFDFNGFPAVEVGRAVRDAGLECIGCSALTGQVSLVSDDAGVRRQAREFIASAVRATAEMGANLLVGPYITPVGYLPGRRSTEEEWKHAVEGLRMVGELLDQYQVSLALEPLNRFEAYFLNTVDDAVKLCEEAGHPRIGILFDTFHANIEEKDVPAACSRAGKHLKHVHTCENDRGIPGSGHVAWDGVMGVLRDMNYQGWLVIESFGFTIKEIAAAACIWRDIAPSPEAIAFEGVKFLRSCCARP